MGSLGGDSDSESDQQTRLASRFVIPMCQADQIGLPRDTFQYCITNEMVAHWSWLTHRSWDNPNVTIASAPFSSEIGCQPVGRALLDSPLDALIFGIVEDLNDMCVSMKCADSLPLLSAKRLWVVVRLKPTADETLNRADGQVSLVRATLAVMEDPSRVSLITMTSTMARVN